MLTYITVVMILRVYAMWDQSKIILGILLLFYVPQIIVSVFWEVMYNNPNGTLSGMFWAKLAVPTQY